MGSLRMPPRIQGKKFQPVSIREFQTKRNRLLILRATGGLGDILMHRMLFEDFKLLAPDAKIIFAIPRVYWPAVQDHPFIDEIVDSTTVNPDDYMIHYVTTTSCGRHENKIAPLSDKHRSDIWAEHCGVRLTRHEMHIRLSEEERQFGVETLARYKEGRPVVLLSPVSAMASKNLDAKQMNSLARALKDRGFSVVCIHNTPVPEMKEAPVWSTNNIRQWMGVINAADAVVSVDTATFHCAGGLKKPLVGIFTWADGLVYGKWFDFVLVQKHRSYTPGWGCGPCYKWHDCPKCPSREIRKPCITELSTSDIMTGVELMLSRWTQLRPVSRPFNQDHNQDRQAPHPDFREALSKNVSAAAVLVKAGCSSADQPARVELPVLQATV